MYRIKLTARAKKELKYIKKSNFDIIDAVFEDISENPYVGKALARELTGRFSYRVSIFRIVYKIKEKDKKVNILTLGHRSTVYK